jgi:hypothetical protein
MIKPQLTSSAEAAFSKLDFKSKPNTDIAYYIDKGRFIRIQKNKTIKKLLQQSNPISNLQLGKDNGVCFLYKMKTSLNLIQSKEHWYKSLIFRRERKGKVEEKESFEKSAKRIISIYSGSKQRKIGIRQSR